MRRVYVLIGVILVAWVGLETDAAIGNSSVALAPQQNCCPVQGQTNPHKECLYGSCQDVQTCGYDQCSMTEYDCIVMGWEWDPYSCTCNPPACDQSQKWACLSSGGIWDDFFCVCDYPPCNPGSPMLAGQTSASYQGCVDGQAADCTTYWNTYIQYCQDGSVYDEWTEETTFCVPNYNNPLPCYS